MKVTASAADLVTGYEALRAQVLGTIPAVRPRGLVVLRRAGLVAWMAACPPPASNVRRRSSHLGDAIAHDGLDGELVSILTEMALGRGWGWRDAP